MHAAAPERPSAHPLVFLPLYLPFGVSIGYLSVTLEYELTHAGVSTLAFSGLVALAILPQTIKVLWAPVVDTTLSAKTWYLLAVAIAAPSLALTGLIPLGPASMPIISVLTLFLSVAISFIGIACDRLMALATAPSQRGQAGGWSQAGNVGGVGVGGGVGLWLAVHTHMFWIASCAVGGVVAASALALLFTPEPPPAAPRPGLRAAFLGVLADCWATGRSRGGALTLLLFLLPIGTSASSNLFAAVAREWRASAGVLANLAWIGGTTTAGGAVLGGWLCDRLDRRVAYGLFGLIQALVATAMALSPRTPLAFVACDLCYAATIGLTYAAFAAVTLDAIGAGAAATKYNLFACASNIPIAYMGVVDGSADTHWNAGVMLGVEAGAAAIGAVVFAAVALGTRAPTARAAPA